MSPKQPPPEAADDKQPPQTEDERGSNAVEHKPDPKAEPLPDGGHKYVPRSPYTTGNS